MMLLYHASPGVALRASVVDSSVVDTSVAASRNASVDISVVVSSSDA